MAPLPLDFVALSSLRESTLRIIRLLRIFGGTTNYLRTVDIESRLGTDLWSFLLSLSAFSLIHPTIVSIAIFYLPVVSEIIFLRLLGNAGPFLI
jgi:hypothetical protein